MSIRQPEGGDGHAARHAGLTAESIVDAARTIARTEGFEGVTMRKLARMLNITAPAIYWHLPTRQALLERLTVAITRDAFSRSDPAFAVVSTLPEWIEATRTSVRDARQVYRDYPGLAGSLLRRTPATDEVDANPQVQALLRLGFELTTARHVNRVGARWVLAYYHAESIQPSPSVRGMPQDDAIFEQGLQWLLDGVAVLLGGGNRKVRHHNSL